MGMTTKYSFFPSYRISTHREQVKADFLDPDAPDGTSGMPGCNLSYPQNLFGPPFPAKPWAAQGILKEINSSATMRQKGSGGQTKNSLILFYQPDIMPTIAMSFNDLLDLIGSEVDRDHFIERVAMLGSDVSKCEGDELEIEFFPDRPDLYSVEGVARSMRAFLGFETGLKQYPMKKSDIVMNVEGSVSEIRPFVGAALIKGVTMTDPLIQSIMGIQEKLHLTLGRKRVKVAIGVHDFDQVVPPFTYKAIDPEGITFVPLFMDEEMDLAEILRKHEKGMEYAFTLDGLDRYPIIIDQNWDVLSFPPIINGELTAVTESTQNIFLDVTGHDKKTVHYALNIIATMLAERGGQIYTVEVRYPDHKEVLPDLAPVRMKLGCDYANRFLGTGFSSEEISLYLSRMGFGSNVIREENGGELEVGIPAYRTDILHPIDLVEDVAIGFGFENFSPLLPETMTFGKARELEEFAENIRTFFIGHGYLEVMTLALSCDDDQFRKMGLPVGERVIIRNPISKDHTNIRVWLLPTLLNTLRANLHRDLPQRIFEVGDAVIKGKNVRKVGGVSIHRKASFTEVKGLVKSFLASLGIDDYDLVPADHPSFIRGRAGNIMTKDRSIGTFGEFHPRTITRFSMSNPVVGFEFDVETLLD